MRIVSSVLLLVLVAVSLPGIAGAQAKELVFSGYGGDYGEVMR